MYSRNISGQIIVFHQPRFPWNKKTSLPKRYLLGEIGRVFGASSLIWPQIYMEICLPTFQDTPSVPRELDQSSYRWPTCTWYQPSLTSPRWSYGWSIHPALIHKSTKIHVSLLSITDPCMVVQYIYLHEWLKCMVNSINNCCWDRIPTDPGTSKLRSSY